MVLGHQVVEQAGDTGDRSWTPMIVVAYLIENR